MLVDYINKFFFLSLIIYIDQAILTRANTINGLSYKDDPSIFAWELINEPRCLSDLSGTTLQVHL